MPAIAKSRKGIKPIYNDLGPEVQSFFSELPDLIDSTFSLEIALAYVFFRVEYGQRLTLHCGALKLHKTEATLTWCVINGHDLTRDSFKELFKTIYGFPASKSASGALPDAEKSETS